MISTASFDQHQAPLADALVRQGFTELTSVQQAVLDPALAGRDLRISSQTGSGKTVAMGLVMAPLLTRSPASKASKPTPRVLFIAPTRELAVQIGRELTWLLRPISASVVVVTGGTSFRTEMRTLQSSTQVVVGTPGRLLDHLERGTIDPSAVAAVVLDEADQMLDLGFRDELEAILGKTPTERQTHMMSATFSREVLALALRYQRDAVHVEGTALGRANTDIEHIAHLVRPAERNAALVNLLLMAGGERTLVFVRTRADASELSEHLSSLGFAASALHGDLEQAERHRTLDAFRSNNLGVLVATDVAARGIDVPDVARVIHADPPGDAEVYTHRSGRTGRAGRKGASVILVPPSASGLVQRFFRAAGVSAKWSSPPSPSDVLRAADESLRQTLVQELSQETPPAARIQALAERLLADHDPVQLVASLLGKAHHAGPCEPMHVSVIAAAAPAPSRKPVRNSAGNPFVPFRINWGHQQGADPRRLLALACRRGRINGHQIGAIRIGDRASMFEVAAEVAIDFARSVRKPDPRDPHIRIERADVEHDAQPPPWVRDHAAPRRIAPRHDVPEQGGFRPARRIPARALTKPVRVAG